MKSQKLLFQCVLQDMGALCCTSTIHDLNTVMERSEHEGISFFTITLPAFCKSFESCLELGLVAHDSFIGFRYRKGLPAFLSGFLELVFDLDSGRLLESPSIDAIFAIRQITLLFKKILLPCSERRTRKAFNGYLQCESEVQDWEQQVDGELLRHFSSVSSVLWGHDLSIVDHKVYDRDLLPRHGPGATAERVSGNAKYRLRQWHDRLEEYFPSAEFLIPNQGFYEELDSVDFAEPGAELPVRVITVPKTLKTPRIIAIEPTCMQYTQQALMDILVQRLESSDKLSGMLGFTDQTPNQVFARVGSEDGSLATIDLKEASDRVSNLLVKTLLQPFPHLLGAVQACRSVRADLPGHGIIPLSKFASMGSALCFPIEAMVFLTIIFCGIARGLNRRLTDADIQKYRHCVRVYGDDIIVPAEIVQSVVGELHRFNCVVNTSKSFWNGKFRESCGRDYYDGRDVTVTYVRRNFPQHRRDAQEILSLISLRNQLYKAGLWTTCGFLDREIKALVPFPIVGDESPVAGRHSFLLPEGERVCPKLHKPLVRGVVVRSVARRSVLDGPAALLKHFLKRGVMPFHDKLHLERYGRPEHVDIKVRWASVQ